MNPKRNDSTQNTARNQEKEGPLFSVYFSGKKIGQSLRVVAVDLIKTENDDLISHWYHSATGTDLFTWTDHGNNILKQQLNCNGQVVEWNCLEGIKTGVVIEQDMEFAKKNNEEEFTRPSETIHFDTKPQNNAVAMALDILNHTEIEAKYLSQLIGNLKNPQSLETMDPSSFLERYGLSLKNFEKQDHGFWQNLKSRFRSLFDKS